STRWTADAPRARPADAGVAHAGVGAADRRARAGRDHRRPAGVHQPRRSRALPRADGRTALREVPEPVAGRFQCRHRPGPAKRGAGADAQGHDRRRDQAVPGRALRRIRAVPPACRADHLAAVVRSCRAAAGGRAGGGGHRAPPCGSACGRCSGRGARPGAGVVMSVFVIASLVLALLVLALVLRPVWRDRPLAGAGMLAGLLVTTGLLYALVGTPRALDASQRRAPESLSEAIVQLTAELERDPNQIEGWRLLARAHAAEGRFAESRDAYARAVLLAPDEPALLAEAAEARAKADPSRLFDETAVAMLRHALEIEPQHQRARWFLGIARRQAGAA